ncbi:MAG: YeeE/YedE family protein [Marinicellaceae bacterium]
MMIDEIITPFLGGVTIGISAILMMLFKGKIAGISGMFKGIIWDRGYERYWRLAFILGVVFSSIVYFFLFPEHLIIREKYSIYLLAISGTLVGIGTYFSNGCTSGHGVCGVSRLSKRSIFSTIIFVIFGVISVYMTRVYINL